MKKTIISIIAAIGKNGELGKDNKLLWHIPEDMKRFKELTKGHVVIMGRKTFESIGKPLPNRLNIIVTRDKNYDVSKYHNNDLKVCSSVELALELAKSLTANNQLLATSEIFIIGGGQIFEQAMKYTDRLYMTIVTPLLQPNDVNRLGQADTFFPDYSAFKKVVHKKESRDKNYRYTFLDLER